jgi:hypothetical protein
MPPISAWILLGLAWWFQASSFLSIHVVEGLANNNKPAGAPPTRSRTTSSAARTRRDVISQSMVVSGGLLTLAGMMTLDAASASDTTTGTTASSMSSSSSLAMDGSSFQTYQVMPDASEALNPQLQELKVRERKESLIMGLKNNEGSNILSTNKLLFCLRACFSLHSSLFFHQSSSFLDRIAASRQGGAVWLGEHHNSASDHVLQATMVQSIWT